MKKIRVHVVFLAVLLSITNIRCSSGSSLLKAGSPLLSSLGSVANLSKFTSLLQTPGLDKLIGGALKKPFTLLAPTNDALNSLSSSAMSALSNPSNLNSLASMVKNQIVPGKLDANGLMQSGLKTAAGSVLDLGGGKLGDLISGDKFNIFPIDKVLGGG